jgi:hypothetical protein
MFRGMILFGILLRGSATTEYSCACRFIRTSQHTGCSYMLSLSWHHSDFVKKYQHTCPERLFNCKKISIKEVKTPPSIIHASPHQLRRCCHTRCYMFIPCHRSKGGKLWRIKEWHVDVTSIGGPTGSQTNSKCCTYLGCTQGTTKSSPILRKSYTKSIIIYAPVLGEDFQEMASTALLVAHIDSLVSSRCNRNQNHSQGAPLNTTYIKEVKCFLSKITSLRVTKSPI